MSNFYDILYTKNSQEGKMETVLLVMEDQREREGVSSALRVANLKVLASRSGEEAAKAALCDNPEVLVISEDATGSDGVPLWCSLPKLTSIDPYVVVIGDGGDGVVEYVLDHDVDFYLTRPLKLSAVVAWVHAATRRVRSFRVNELLASINP